MFFKWCTVCSYLYISIQREKLPGFFFLTQIIEADFILDGLIGTVVLDRGLKKEVSSNQTMRKLRCHNEQTLRLTPVWR